MSEWYNKRPLTNVEVKRSSMFDVKMRSRMCLGSASERALDASDCIDRTQFTEAFERIAQARRELDAAEKRLREYTDV